MAASFIFAFTFLMIFVANRITCLEIEKTDIKVVRDENRYLTLNPNATLTSFGKINNAKGNSFFKLGERIPGDRVIDSHLESTTFTKATDVEVSIWYPIEGHDAYKITCIEFVTDSSTEDINAFLVGDGGILTDYFEALLSANATHHFGYHIVFFGF